MKTFFAVVLGVGLGAGSMFGWQSYQEHQADKRLSASFQALDEDVKAYMRCMGIEGANE